MKKNNQHEFEAQRLKQTITLAESLLEKARLDNEGRSAQILALKKEMREGATHSVSNLYSSQSFEDLVELAQYANPIIQKVADYEKAANRIAVLEKVIASPYFARIDFKFDDEDALEQIYIGRSALRECGSYESYVYDWRAPIASMFYRFAPGAAFYDAPAGRVTGEISLKRQYEIKNGELKYFFDADVEIMDEFLRKMLSQNASSKMKSIVETIQREQDIVIRDMTNDLMMVQGVAGSGKTSIALHRAAYLMYQGLASDKLAADNILIISPNTVFEEYISNVLPELGEENVVSMVFDEMLRTVLQRRHIQTRNRFLEALITSPRYGEVMKKSIELKTSRQFMRILNELACALPPKWSLDEAKERYTALFNNEELFCGLEPAKCINDILEFTRANLCAKTLYYDDASALAYLKLKHSKTNKYRHIKQVVIDEAQDYYPLHYEIFNLLFPNAKYTVLGDVNQTLEKQGDLTLYEEIREILNKKRAALVTMDKSFRCTNEILSFSSQFLPRKTEIKSFGRKGEEPGVYIAADSASLCDMVLEEIRLCKGAGYKSIGLICKTEQSSRALFKKLKDKTDIRLIKNEDTADLQGVFIIPVYMSKGLEFDAALVCGEYHEDDRRLLYIACTRALHRLSLFG